jgi:DNA repair photolyase
MKKQSTYGFKEWTVHSVNCCSGCSNNCRYCYAKGMAVRFKQMTPEEWPLERIRQKDVDKAQKLYPGRVMFPSSHDITPGNFDACFTVLEKLLVRGNEILIVSKPRLECIKRICHSFIEYRDRILFRFSITAMNDELFSFWEPGAPVYAERKDALVYSVSSGFGTSVSIEPMIDSENVVQLVEDLVPYVTDAIWIGKMNHIRKNIQIDSPELEEAVRGIEEGQTDDRIKAIFNALKDNPQIKWKGGIKKIIGIEPPDVPGLDI